MKNLFFVTIVVLASSSSGQTQTNFSFPKDSAEWVVYKVYGIIGPNDNFIVYRDFLHGDSMYMGKTYSRTYRQPLCWCTCPAGNSYQPQNIQQPYLTGGVREEAGKVYFTKFGSDGSEYFKPFRDTLLFDFSAQVGDTIAYANDKQLKITSIDTASDGRKKINYVILPIGYPHFWWEGIGSEGLFETLEWFNLNFDDCCFSPGIPSACSYPCYVMLTAAHEPGEKSVVQANPTVTGGWVTLTFPESWDQADVQVFTSDGHLQTSHAGIRSGESMDLTTAPAGMLLLLVRGADRQTAAVRVVRE